MKDVLKKVAPYSKFVVSLGGAVAITGQVVADASVSATEVGAVATAFATAVGVLMKANAGSEA